MTKHHKKESERIAKQIVAIAARPLPYPSGEYNAAQSNLASLGVDLALNTLGIDAIEDLEEQKPHPDQTSFGEMDTPTA